MFLLPRFVEIPDGNFLIETSIDKEWDGLVPFLPTGAPAGAETNYPYELFYHCAGQR